LLDERYYKILDDSINFNCQKYQADIIAYVWMPNHIHLIVFFEENIKLPEFMRDFKKYTGAQIRRLLEIDQMHEILRNLKYSIRTQKFKICNDRYDATYIKDKNVMFKKINYIHNNPIRKNFVSKAENYKNSSAMFYETERQGAVKIRHGGEIIY